jgi:hypothetical protein
VTRFLALFDRHAGTLAVLLCAVSIVGFAAGFAPFSHRQHPLGLLGADGVPAAAAFNLLAFVIPGLLAAAIFARLRVRLPAQAGRLAGIGAWVLVISALAFAAQGVWTLDPEELDSADSQWHTTSWLVWWLAFVPGALLLGLGLRTLPQWQGRAYWFLAAGVLAVVLNLLPSTLLAGPIAQRLVLVLWLVSVWMASRPRA